MNAGEEEENKNPLERAHGGQNLGDDQVRLPNLAQNSPRRVQRGQDQARGSGSRQASQEGLGTQNPNQDSKVGLNAGVVDHQNPIRISNLDIRAGNSPGQQILEIESNQGQIEQKTPNPTNNLQNVYIESHRRHEHGPDNRSQPENDQIYQIGEILQVGENQQNGAKIQPLGIPGAPALQKSLKKPHFDLDLEKESPDFLTKKKSKMVSYSSRPHKKSARERDYLHELSKNQSYRSHRTKRGRQSGHMNQSLETLGKNNSGLDKHQERSLRPLKKSNVYKNSNTKLLKSGKPKS